MKMFLPAASAGLLLVSACATNGGPSRNVITGAGVGAVAGAGVGAMAGGNDTRNAAIGAAVGALAGAAVGDYMDKQERALRQATANSNIEVERRGDQIQLTAPSDVTFDVSSAQIKSAFYPTLNDVASTLKQFPQTSIDIVGHASTDGDASFNQSLSERRAASVSSYLTGQGVNSVRIKSYGYGESQPLPGIPGNSPANRRVEMILTPVVDETA